MGLRHEMGYDLAGCGDDTMRKLPLVLAMLLSAGSAYASGDTILLKVEQTVTNGAHLEPESSILSGGEDLFFANYYAIVQDAFQEVYSRDFVLRAVVMPSFQPEFVVAMQPKDDGFQLVALNPEQSLWSYIARDMVKNGQIRKIRDDTSGAGEPDSQSTKEPPSDYHDMPLARCSVDIDAARGERIKHVWQAVLMQTRYDEKGRQGSDGVTFHFSMFVNYQFLAGRVWTPALDAPPGMLAKIAYNMREYCENHSAETLVELDARLVALSLRMKLEK
jgi:hypothetical protein